MLASSDAREVTRSALLEAQLALPDDAVEGAALYISLLAWHGARANLVGTLDLGRLARELVVDSMRAAPLVAATVATGGRIADVGSGAGIPAVPLLLALPGWQAVAIEPRARRRAFLSVARRELGLGERLVIVDGRVEGGRLRVTDGSAVADREAGFTIASSKAVFAPGDWLRVASGLTCPGGYVLVYGSAVELAPIAADREPVASLEYTLSGGPMRAIALFRGGPIEA